MRTDIKILFSGLFLAGFLTVSGKTYDPNQLPGNPALSAEVFVNDKAAPAAIRRKAFRILAASKEYASSVLSSGISDKDPVIRGYVYYSLMKQNKNTVYELLKKAVAEPDERAASILLSCAETFPDKEKSMELLKLLLKSSPVLRVRRAAFRIVDFPYFLETRRLKDDPTHDHEVVTVKSIRLPLEGWSFRVDPGEDGHHKNYYGVNFNDSRWKKLRIGAWEEQGYPGYDGVAWYRIKFKMPAKIDSNAVELVFGAVDESAWIWLNGEYVGQHDIGTVGWDKTFAVDVTKQIRWGGENVLAVRVEDTAQAGGIWKPVGIDVLK